MRGRPVLKIRGRKFNNNENNENVWEVPMHHFNIRNIKVGNRNFSSNIRWANKPDPINVRRVNTMSFGNQKLSPSNTMNITKELQFSTRKRRRNNNNRNTRNTRKYYRSY